MRALLLPLPLGALLAAAPARAAVPAAGDLVVTEILGAASCQYNEWFEVYNPTSTPMELGGCDLVLTNPESGSVSDHTVAGSPVVNPGQYAVLYRSAASCGDVTCVDEACAVPVLYKYGTLQFSNDSPRAFALVCGGVTVDSLTVDLDEFRCDDGTYGSCSVQLSPSSLTAAANDDATVEGAWCPPDVRDVYTDANPDTTAVRTALATPGAPNRCGDGGVSGGGDGGDGTDGGDGGGDGGDEPVVVPPDVCRPGDLTISELMIAPKDPANADEWIEVTGTGGACNLHSCVIESWKATGSVAEDEHTINVSGESLPLAPGAQVVLARGTSADRDAGGISWSDAEGNTVSAGYLYDYDVYLRSEPGEVRIVCDGELIDSAPMDWSLFSDLTGGCPDGWCSVNLHPGYVDPAQNDDLARWCIPPTDGNLVTHTDPTGAVFQQVSTVGKPNECPSFNWPAAGEAAFAEIMVSPQGTEEWFELFNASDRALELTLCTLKRTKYEVDEETGEYGPGSESTWLIGEDGVEVSVEPGAVQLFAKSGCLIPDAVITDSGAEASPATSDCSLNEVIYGSLSFTSDGDEVFQLICPTELGDPVLVDEIKFNFSSQGIREGHSLQLDRAALDTEAATANDDPASWCEAAFSQEFYKAPDSTEDCNYGTPGELGECLTDPLNPPKTVCRCASTSWRGLWPAWALPLVALLRRRRR